SILGSPSQQPAPRIRPSGRPALARRRDDAMCPLRLRPSTLKPRKAGRVTILQLSDLHFDQASLKAGPANEYREYLSAWLCRHHGPKSDDPIDLIAATGDLADFDRNHRGKQTRVFQEAKRYLLNLC